MREFSSLGSFGLHLLSLQVAEGLALHRGLKQVAEHVEATAKAEIGAYQPAVGPFPAWAPLADNTEDQKARMGYPADSPLLASGDMRDSIENEVEGTEAVIGSKSEKLFWQELGTEAIPPRPVLGPALVINRERIHQILGDAAAAGLAGGDVLSSELGYTKSLD